MNYPDNFFSRPEAKRRAQMSGLIDVENEDLAADGLIAKMKEWQESEREVDRFVYDDAAKRLRRMGERMPSGIVRASVDEDCRATHRVAGELVRLARQLIAMNDEEFIADQLNNAWEVTPEREMLEHLSSETRYSRSKLRLLVKKWYDDSRLRMKMDLARTTEWVQWIKSELGK